MGLFDFFKRKSLNRESINSCGTEESDNNLYLLEALRKRLIELGYQAEKHPQYHSLIVNTEIEIATVIIDNPNNHPNILHLMILTVESRYFPNGIEENIVGIGTNIQDKINSAIDNYINMTFLAIIDSFTDSHNPDLDFFTVMNDKEVLWHPKLGNLALQGQWNIEPENEPFFGAIKYKLKDKLTSNKLNWLKLYISKQPDGTILGECLFNNEPWDDGLVSLTEYARTWELKDGFQGMKQFIVFRKCDEYDD